MAPLPITEDYYKILEVGQTASNEVITKSYRRLALKLHPDRNIKHDATQAFQLLGRAYEVLKDPTRRRDYDLVYPGIARAQSSSQTTQEPNSSKASTTQSRTMSETAQIAALQKSKQERATRWRTKKRAFELPIFDLERDIRKIEKEIKILNNAAAADAAVEAQKNSWGAWLLSPVYKRPEESEEVKARKDRERQERRIETDMKERRLHSRRTDLKKKEDLFREAENEIKAADMSDDRKIQAIETRIKAREQEEKEKRERLERERLEKIRKQQRQEWEERTKKERDRLEKLRKQQQEQRERQEREAAEVRRKHQAEVRAAEQRRQEEDTKRRQRNFAEQTRIPPRTDNYFDHTEAATHDQNPSICGHGGWWPKVQGRANCPTCSDSWTYLLQCPGCATKACPKCQSAMRPRRPRGAARTQPRARSPHFPHYDFYD